MFENRITTTQLTGPLGDCMFRRINGDEYEGDVSFLATTRALLMNRMSNDMQFHMRIDSFILTSMNAETRNARITELKDNSTVYLVSVKTESAIQASEEDIEAFGSIAVPEGFNEATDVREFFSSKMLCRMMINELTQTTIIMIVNMDMRKYHLVQCMIPRIVPWFFHNARLSVAERNLLYSLRERGKGAYEQSLNVLCDVDSFRQKHTAALLSSFKRRGLEKQQRSIESSIRSNTQHVERLQNDLLNYLRKINEDNFKLSGILTALNGDINTSDELSAFIAANRNIKLLNAETDGIYFIIRGHLDIFDSEAYRTMARNVNCWYWTYGPRYGTFASRENKKRLLDAIFGPNPEFKLKTCGHFKLCGDYGEVSARSGYAFGPEYMDCYPNPHLYYNACLGAHRAPINKALQQGDLVGAVSQCISSVHSVNVTESASFKHIISDIFERTSPILDGPDGKSYTVEQAHDYLLAKERAARQGA